LLGEGGLRTREIQLAGSTRRGAAQNAGASRRRPEGRGCGPSNPSLSAINLERGPSPAFFYCTTTDRNATPNTSLTSTGRRTSGPSRCSGPLGVTVGGGNSGTYIAAGLVRELQVTRLIFCFLVQSADTAPGATGMLQPVLITYTRADQKRNLSVTNAGQTGVPRPSWREPESVRNGGAV